MASHSLELEIKQLKVPSLSDFSKVKCILTVNHYTQCLSYPFKTMLIPIVDDFSVLEVSISCSNLVIAGIDIPLTLFKNKKVHTFRLNEPNSSPEKKKSGKKPQLAEITLGIKYLKNDQTIEEYKSEIKDLEGKVRKTEGIMEEGLKSKREMQNNFEEITKNLAKMVQAQDETIKHLMQDREKINLYLQKVENDLKVETCEGIRGESVENRVRQGKTKEKSDKAHAKSIDSRFENEKRQNYDNFEVILLQKKLEQLESINKTLKKDKESLNDELEMCQIRINDLEMRPEGKMQSEETIFNEKSQKTEGIVLNLRSEIARISVKYKFRINKLSESRNSLIQEKKELLEKVKMLENHIKSLEKPNIQVPTLDPPNIPARHPHNLLGKYAINVKKLEKALETSPKFQTPPKFQISDLKPSETSRNHSESKRSSEFSPLDQALSDYFSLHSHNSEVFFSKDQEGIYNFGSKRVFLKLEQGKIFARIGGGFMPIDEFIKTYSPLESHKEKRRKNSEIIVSLSPFKKFSKNPQSKYIQSYGVQRRSASVSKIAKAAI